MPKMLNRRFLFIAAAFVALTGCATPKMPVSVADTLAGNNELSTLNGLVATAGLAETLQGSGPFTLFAPTNAAFAKVPAKTMDDLAMNPAKLKAVLAYHVVPTRLLAADVKNANLKTVNGANVAVSKAGEFVTIEDAMVQKADILATNGVVHLVDSVLLPPSR
jgi:uncharacterized surface protein with fasciclin (FAS1) repeats